MSRPLGRCPAFVLLIVGAACAGDRRATPGSPSPVTASLAGSWAGAYTPVCPSSANCASVGAAPNAGQPLALVLGQSGTSLTGQINLAGWLQRVADVTGSVDDNGVMSLNGGMSWPATGFCTPAGSWRLTAWNARHDRLTDAIFGSFSYVTQKHLSSCYYRDSLDVNAVQLTLQRGRMSVQPFTGHWQGTRTVIGCRAVGWQRCLNDSGEFPFELQLSQTGQSVTGRLSGISGSPSGGISVTGTIADDGRALTIGGSIGQDVSSAIQTFRITGWSTIRDEIGRLQGSFSYVDEIRWTAGPSAGAVWSMTYDAELRSVIAVPW